MVIEDGISVIAHKSMVEFCSETLSLSIFCNASIEEEEEEEERGQRQRSEREANQGLEAEGGIGAIDHEKIFSRLFLFFFLIPLKLARSPDQGGPLAAYYKLPLNRVLVLHALVRIKHRVLGCCHYNRRCKIRAPCCNEIHNCRHCHNEANNSLETPTNDRHDVPRHEVKKVICSLCDTEQDVGQNFKNASNGAQIKEGCDNIKVAGVAYIWNRFYLNKNLPSSLNVESAGPSCIQYASRPRSTGVSDTRVAFLPTSSSGLISVPVPYGTSHQILCANPFSADLTCPRFPMVSRTASSHPARRSNQAPASVASSGSGSAFGTQQNRRVTFTGNVNLNAGLN